MRRRALLPAILAGWALSGCAMTESPPVPPLSVATPPAWTNPVETGAVDAAWWTGFQDPQLDGLVSEALSANRDIAAAIADLAAADALSDAARSDLYPALDAAAGADIAGDFDGDTDAGGAVAALFGWTPDLFGRTQARLDQAEAQAAARAFALQNIRRLTAASVARRYVELERTQVRLVLLDTSLELQRQTLEIVRRRFEAGLAADLDVQRAAADLARTRAQRGTLEIAAASAANQLAILLARTPGEADLLGGAEPDVPRYAGGPAAGAPADLLRNRPDLRAAEASLAAAAAAVGVERADLYPSLSLPGRITADIGNGASLAEAVLVSLSASLDIPLLDGGRRQAEIAAAQARLDSALANYEQALLESLAEVETALVAIESTRARRDELATAVTASEQAFEQLDALYREGLASFIDILDAQRTLIDSREAYVDSEADLAAAMIDLYEALGAPANPPR